MSNRSSRPSILTIAAFTSVACGFAVAAVVGPVVSRLIGDDDVSSVQPSTATNPSASPRQGPLRLTRVASVPGPVALEARGGDEDLYLATLPGTVRRLRPAPDGSLRLVDEPVLDLTDVVRSGQGEQGLFDVLFSPEGDHMLVSYTTQDGALIVDAFPVVDRELRADDAVRILRVAQIRDNHNGGGMVFGPDGMLYVGLGDGGSDDGPSVARSLAESQDTSTLLGSLLRIEPDLDRGGYATPADNPFVGGPGRDEIWLYGLRNPFRPYLDRDGSLWIPDVGAADREEVNRFDGDQPGRGANLGWGLMEGSIPVFDSEPPPDHDPPEFEYSHDAGRCAIVGGVRVDGARYPDLAGRFLFSDFCGGGLLSLIEGPDGTLVEEEIDVPVEGADRLGSVVAVEQPVDEVYVVDLDGNVYRLDGR